MGIRHGMQGSCKIEGSSLLNNVDFSVNVMQGTTESHGIGDTWTAKYAVGKSWGGSVSGYYDPDDVTLAALVTAMNSATYDELYMTAISLYDAISTYFTGSCIITSVTVTKAVGAVDTISFDFEGKGPLSYS